MGHGCVQMPVERCRDLHHHLWPARLPPAFGPWLRGPLPFPRPSTAAIALARAAFALALGCLVGANAVHHFRASGLGGGLHHFAARWFACTAPDRLAAHGDGLGLFAWLRAKAFK